MIRFLGFLIIAGVISSCVSNKKIVYLQKGNELKEEVEYDTVVRTYNLANYEYRIQPEDILSIRFESLTLEEFNIFANQESQNINQNNLLIGGHLVDKNGNIRFPEIGEVEVAGLTIHEIENKLVKIASSYLEEPSVKVRLLNLRISVLGEVAREGLISSLNNRITLLEALALAGGVGDLADRSKVKVIRQNDGNSEVLYVNLLDENLMNSTGFFIHPNDIIIVPPLKQRPFRKYFGQNLSIFLSTVSIILLTANLLNN